MQHSADQEQQDEQDSQPTAEQIQREQEAARKKAEADQRWRDDLQRKQAEFDKALAAARANPALNPFGKSSSGKSNGVSDGGSTSAAASGPLDPSQNYDGQSCRYFTKGNDDAHVNAYSDGAWASYGAKVYRCVGGHWKYQYPTSVLNAADAKRLDANAIESTSVSTDVYEPE